MIASIPEPVNLQTIQPIVYRLSVKQYHQMIDAGILTPEDNLELLEGWLVKRMTKNPPHVFASGVLYERLFRMIQGYFINNQEPITLAHSEPEPDITVIRGQRRDYAKRHPYAQDVALVMEVSDSTLEQDRTIKKRIYARAGIPVYWIVNLPEQQIEVYSEPTESHDGPTYATRTDYLGQDTVPVVIAGQTVGTVAVSEILLS